MRKYKLEELKLRVVDPKFARAFIGKYHYSKNCPTSLLVAIGEYIDDTLVNCIVFNHPSMNGMSQMIWKGGNDSNTIELARMVSLEPKPKNLETYCISRALDYLKKNYPKYKICVSYADNAMGHHGYCYQASNFIYFGQSVSANMWWVDGERVHQRTIYSRYGTNSLPKLKEMLGDRVQKETNGPSKSRYYIILAQSKKEKKEIEKLIKVPTLPYPKGDNQKYNMGTKGEFAYKDKEVKNEIDDTKLYQEVNLFD